MKKNIKKSISYFIALFVLLFPLQSVFATKHCNVQIAVFCDDENMGRQFIELACRYTYVETPQEAIPLESQNFQYGCTSIRLDDMDTVYEIKFDLIPKAQVDSVTPRLSSKIKKCSGAIILYDIADVVLEPIVRSNTFFKSDIKRLTELKHIPLVNYVKYLQGFFRKGWFNAIDFVTYGKSNLEESDYNLRHAQINRFTCEMERFYNVDNKWGRGHPDLEYEKCLNYTMRWISGVVYRSIGDGTIDGDLHTEPPPSTKKKVVAGMLIVSGIVIVCYGIYLLK